MSVFASNLSLVKLGILPCLVCLLCAQSVEAAWLGYVNQTPTPIVVQAIVINANKAQVIRQHKLFFGERAWDNIAVAGLIQIKITDPAQKNAILLQQNINIANQDVLLAIQWQPQPQIQGKPPVPPALRLIPIAIVGAPGINGPVPQPQPKEAPKQGPNAPVPPRGPLPPTATPTPPPAENPDKPKETPKDKPKDAPGKPKPNSGKEK